MFDISIIYNQNLKAYKSYMWEQRPTFNVVDISNGSTSICPNQTYTYFHQTFK
jgi:hypothetical protein